MSIDTEIAKGVKLREQGKLEESIECFDRALRISKKLFKAHLEKSITLHRLKRYDEAEISLTLAQKLAIERERKHLVAQVMFRFGVLYLKKGDLQLSCKYMNTAVHFGISETEVAPWKTQLQFVAKEKEADIDYDVKYANITDLPEKEVPENALVDEPSEQDMSPLAEIGRARAEFEELTKSKEIVYPKVEDIKRDWYQALGSVTVSIFIKNLPSDKTLKVNFTSKSVHFEFPTSPHSEYQYEIAPLYAPIDPVTSSYRVFPTKIELYLSKEVNEKWRALTDETSDLTTEDSNSLPLQYPSSYHKRTNWDTIEYEADPMEDVGENAFFRNLYKDADDDTKRAMMKSYIESNGTALSTNWDEVEKKTYETTPPKGMELRKW